MHVRAAIRQAFIARLRDNTPAHRRIFSRARESVGDDECPALMVVTPAETTEDDQQSLSSDQTRVVAVQVHCVAQAGEELADDLDELALAVEKRLAGRDWLPAGITDKRLSATSITFRHEGSKPTAVARLDYLVTYLTNESAPDVAL